VKESESEEYLVGANYIGESVLMVPAACERGGENCKNACWIIISYGPKD